MLASLGLLSVSAKEVKKALGALAGKKPSKKELKKMLNALVKEGKAKRKESEKKAQDIVKKILKELDVPTRSELRVLEKKLSGRAKKR